MRLEISIEIAGSQHLAGYIIGDDINDASFSYASEYLSSDAAVPISISLPLREEPFSTIQTRAFFDGLLPEGYTRRTVAEWIHADEGDYLRILSALGKECLGALQVRDTDHPEDIPRFYEELSLAQVQALAREGATKSAELVTQAHLSLTGASGKVGLYYDGDRDAWYLPQGSAPSTHIVKQSHVRLDGIVTNEQLSLLTAKRLGLDVPETFIVNTGERTDSDVLFATARYDRVFHDPAKSVSGLRIPSRLHQEDFGQALGIPSAGKYERPGDHYLSDMIRVIRQYSSDPIRDQMKLWDTVVFNFLIGNTDAHIKNFSLVHEYNIRSMRLAPAYDIISTTVYPQSTRNMAFAVAGIYDISEIDRNAFAACAKEVGIGTRIALRHFDDLAEQFVPALRSAADELAGAGYGKAIEIRDRILNTAGIRQLT